MKVRHQCTGLEQYYTNENVAEDCVKLCKKYIGNRTILEPSGGTGSFIKAVKNAGFKNKIESYDLQPKHQLVKKADFLKVELKDKNYFTIGNPPFGKASNIAVKFFNKAAEYSDYIAFIIPLNWKRWFIQDKLNKNFHLINEKILPGKQVFNGKNITESGYLKTVFQIWKKKKELRKNSNVVDRQYFETTKPELANCAYVVMGWGVKKGNVEVGNGFEHNTTKMFIKAKNKYVIKALKEIDPMEFSKYSTITPSISGKEIRYLLNKYFDKIKRRK